MPLRSPLLSLCLAALLHGCGGGGTPADADPPARPAPDAPDAPAPTPTPTPPPPPTPTPAQPTAVGAPLGAAVIATIGAAGGRIDAPDGSVSVIVPPGAFDRSRSVGLQPIANLAHGGIGRAWRITPEGLDTPLPMTIEWHPRADETRGMGATGIAFQGADGVWRRPRGVERDAATGALRVRTRHFSDWSHVAGLQLRPGTAAVGVGESVTLTVHRCGSSADPADADLALVHRCAPSPWVVTPTDDWSVNAVEGGSAAVGRIVDRTANDLDAPVQAVYTAPATAPAVNPVAVSVRVGGLLSPQGETLVAEITVIGAQSACAWLQNVQEMSAELDFDYAWSGTGAAGYALTLQQSARTQGRLKRVQTQLPMLAWSGALDTGSALIDDRSVLPAGNDPVVTTLSGSGAPWLGDAPVQAPASAAHVQVDLHDCTVSFGGFVAVLATETNAGIAGPLADRDLGALAYDARPIAGRTSFTGSTRLPVGALHQSGDYYATRALAGVLVPDDAGEASVRWAFRPLP